MRDLRRRLAGLVLALAPVLCPAAEPQAPATPLVQLLADYDAAWLAHEPHLATSLGDRRYDDRLADRISPAWLRRDRELAERFLARLDAIDPSGFSAAERVSADAFRFGVALRAEQHALGIARKKALMPLSQHSGMHIELPLLGSGDGIQPFAGREDHERWLARAAQWPAWAEQAIANMRDGMREGVVLPRVLVERVLPQLQAHIVAEPQQSVFWKPLAALSGAERTALEPRYRALIERAIVPGYRALHHFMREEYLPAARASVARSALPGGVAWYAHEIRQQTTLAASADQLHATGLAQVATLTRDLEAVRALLGHAQPLPDFYASLRTDARWRFASEDAALEAFRTMKTRVRDQLPRYFGRLPRADYEVRAVEPFRAASAASASYQRPDAAGLRPGVFYLNTADLSRTPRFELASLSLHEAEPGHHFQITLAIENTALPGLQRYGSLPAFTEGWALYAETLGWPMGLYEDPVQRLGFLNNRIFRAIRLVVDTGLHARGWTREQAIDYFLRSYPGSESDAIAETERYIASPGQALAYLSGALEIERLRGEAEQQLGASFDLRAFHDEVLADGMVPLPVLEAKLARWISARAAE